MRSTLLVLILGLSVALPQLALAQADSVVVFNEIHYHPADDGQALEFIELYNQNTVNVDLSGWTLDGVGDFTFEQGITIEGRSFLVIAKNPEALGLAGALGPFPGALANDGETLTLRNHNGRIMDQMEYDDSRPWPTGADGSGATLAKRDPMTSSGRPAHWSASRTLGGTPGSPNDTAVTVLPLYVSEVPAVEESPFWIELFNAGEAAIDLTMIEIVSGAGERFPLTGSLAAMTYFQIPLDLTPAEGMRLFVNDTASGQFLDAVILQNEPRARLDFSNQRFFHPDTPTPGAPNEVSLNEAIVINEIMYHHRPHYQDDDDPESVYQENDEEWIELVNRSENTVDLSGWRLREGIRHEFDEGLMLEPGAFLVVAKDAAALRAKHPGITVTGDFRGSLSNGDEGIELQDARGNPVDAVHYFDDAPWPGEADGGGSSLELKNPQMDNALPEAWAASDESLQSEWHTYTYRAVAQRPVYTAGVRNFHELRVGYIQAGRCLIDNVHVIEDPDGSAQNLIRNSTFGSLFAPLSSSNWRMLGNHDQSEAISDPEAGSVLKIAAESPMNYLNNLCEATLSKEVEIGKEYEVRFDAKWLGGSPQLRTEVYYNKFAKKHLLVMPESHGTPGRQNTAYVENPGPVYHSLRHDPPVPTSSQAINVTVNAGDPDGIDNLTLYYSVNEAAWQTVAMEPLETGYLGTIPSQAQNAVVQFYAEGVDAAGARSTYPADGPDSGAFVRVDDPVNIERRQAMRLILRASDNSEIHDPLLILSNARRPATVILNETDIIYNCGIRLRGSMFSRNGGGESGLNIKFPVDQRFRGVQPTIIVRRRNPHEILVKHMANQAVGVPASYNDLVELRGYRSDQSGLARMEMARFGDNYVKGAFEDGDSEPVFKMEGIRDFQQAGTDGIKRPMPIGWIVQYDLADLGDDKEQYRHVLRMISARKRDDYTPMIDLCKAFSAPDEDLRAAVESVIDTDQWARMMAMQTLCGIADVYPIENPHNFNFYRRPTDKKIIAIPWDWDFTFNLPASSRIIDPRSSGKNLWRVLSLPGINRLYRGHLLDLIDTVFNEQYATTWFTHYADVAGTNYGSHINYVGSRGNAVKSQASTATPFAITSNDGDDFTVEAPEVTLQGQAGVRVRSLEHVETGLVLEPYWLDEETWEVTLPLTAEVNSITLQARDYQGTKGSLFNPTGSDGITVTNASGVDAPSSATLLISEIMYHPAAPSASEMAAGFDDQDLFEFIEVLNIGARAIDLQSLRFTDGVQFDFSQASVSVLLPGETGVLVVDENAFKQRYGSGLPVLGTYTGKLSNGGETLTLSSNGRVIQSFTYQDTAPWPEEADGSGRSLTMIDLSGSADPGMSSTWGASDVPGGTPGSIETPATMILYADWLRETFSPEEQAQPALSGFAADPDNDGHSNGVEFALGTSPKERDHGALLSLHHGEELRVDFPRRPNTEATIVIETSTGLESWQPLPQSRILSQTSVPALDGERVSVTIVREAAQEHFRLRITIP